MALSLASRCFVAIIRKAQHVKPRIYAFITLLLFGVIYIIFYEESFVREEDYTVSDFTRLEYFNVSKENITTSSWYESGTRYSARLQGGSNLCPVHPDGLTGILDTQNMFQLRNWSEIESQNVDISQGGWYAPAKCVPRYKVAIIIPLRGRESQLQILLAHMHPIWKRQNIHYKVFVINQSEGTLFNRAKLLNVGVAEARRDDNYDCYVFHDADLLLEDDECLYTCYEPNPRHLSVFLDQFSYKPLFYKLVCRHYEDTQTIYRRYLQSTQQGPEVQIFGGVSMLTAQQFDTINGLSNLYWGWGGEDDELHVRLTKKGYTIENPYGKKCSYRMIPHEHEGKNPTNLGRWALVRYVSMRIDKEGYSTLRYQVMSRQAEQLYTNITVNLGHPSRNMLKYLANSEEESSKCFLKMPWSME